MRIRGTVLVGLTAMLVFSMASVALGTVTPTLTATKTKVTYPQAAALLASTYETSTVMRQLAGASEWTTFAVVASGETTVPVVKPASSALYKLITDGGISSEQATISVAAKLSKPGVRSHGRRWHKMWVTGWVSPLHSGGSVQLAAYRWEKTGSTTVITKRNGKIVKKTVVSKYGWVKKSSTNVALKRLNSQKSKWAYKWTPRLRGTWKFVVSHEDTAHVYSAASARTFIRRW